MRRLRHWADVRRIVAGVEADIDGGGLIRIEALEEALFRVSFLNRGAWRCDRSWSIAPAGDAPIEGRCRATTAGFACPPFETDQTPRGVTLATGSLRVTLGAPLHLRWQARTGGGWRDVAADRPTGAYLLGRRDYAAEHHLLRQPGERHYGLGEKAGPLERSGRRYEMRNLDAMGYDAARTDPLYKHVPFVITRTEGAGSYSLFYDTAAPCWFDLGNEIDNYHRPFRSFRTADGDLCYYLRWAPDLLSLVREQARMTGGTAFPPRWSLGYSGSTMAYTDAPDAEARLSGFLDRLAAHDIPCDSFHLSSGYTSIGARRYVFHWNRDKFPEPGRLGARFTAAGVKLVANIKPCLLDDHPLRPEAEAGGLFIADSETGEPESSVFWDAEGAHLDFTNPATIAWWRGKVTSALLNEGFSATWNDNNEFEVWDRDARCDGFGRPIAVSQIRPVQALLMTRASEEAQRAHAPGRRPYLVTRSGMSGIQRHAQTWTGDNRTAWESLRWNIPMGLGLSLSGFFNIGHDVGGFAGPQPDAELLVRWVQNGIFHPRFSIHSWNPDHSVTEPWTHPAATQLVAEAIRLRYRLLPYLYTCLWRAVRDHEPMLRPLFLDHEDDADAFACEDSFLLGRDLLVASVVEPGARRRPVYLPRNATGWCEFHSGAWHPPGTTLAVPVGLDTIPCFVRAGAVLPLSVGARRAVPGAEQARDLTLYPAPAEFAGQSFCYDDDGDSADAMSGAHLLMRMSLSGDRRGLRLDLARSGRLPPPSLPLRFTVPAGEGRKVTLNGRPALPGEDIPWPR